MELEQDIHKVLSRVFSIPFYWKNQKIDVSGDYIIADTIISERLPGTKKIGSDSIEKQYFTIIGTINLEIVSKTILSCRVQEDKIIYFLNSSSYFPDKLKLQRGYDVNFGFFDYSGDPECRMLLDIEYIYHYYLTGNNQFYDKGSATFIER